MNNSTTVTHNHLPNENIHILITPREKEVLHLIAYEHSDKQIAKTLFLSHHTVHSHRKNLMKKLNVRNGAGLVRRGIELKLITLHLI